MTLATAILVLSTAPVFERTRSYRAAELPFERIHGVAILKDRTGQDSWIVGGLRGLAIGVPGKKWTNVSEESVKQVVAYDQAAWIVFGSGGVDKIVPSTNRHYYDILRNRVKRPWCASSAWNRPVFGGFGAVFDFRADIHGEQYPKELAGKPVCAVTDSRNGYWAGTQDGLIQLNGESVTRFGIGQGLPDPWVTCLLSEGDRVWVGTASGGLCLVQNGKIVRLEGPSKRVRILAQFDKSLIVGTLDGTWALRNETWTRLTSIETTGLAVCGKRLLVCHRNGIDEFRQAD